MEEQKKDVLILAIETSCDETAAAELSIASINISFSSLIVLPFFSLFVIHILIRKYKFHRTPVFCCNRIRENLSHFIHIFFRLTE